MKTVLALDPGYGNTKICFDGRVATMQSAISRPQKVGLAAIGMKTAVKTKIIELDGYEFAIGPDTWHWGNLLSSGDYSAITSPERRALAFGTLAESLPPGEHRIDLMVIGLPVHLLQDEIQAKAVLSGLKTYKGQHSFRIGDDEWILHITRLKALAQPVGAYADWLFNAELQMRKKGRKSEVAVLDIGMNTLDQYVIQDGKVSPRFIGGEKVGVRRLLELLTSNGHSHEELDAKLRAGRLRPDKNQMESWLSEVLASIERVWPNLRRFDTLIPTGGGALILGNYLRTALIAKGASVHWADDPITANVYGLWKWGAYGYRSR
jgi:hypothetical protein